MTGTPANGPRSSAPPRAASDPQEISRRVIEPAFLDAHSEFVAVVLGFHVGRKVASLIRERDRLHRRGRSAERRFQRYGTSRARCDPRRAQRRADITSRRRSLGISDHRHERRCRCGRIASASRLMCSAPRLLVEHLQGHRLSAVKHGTCALRAGVDTLCMRPACAANPRGVEAIVLLDLGPGEGVCPLAEC
jgi:hypothetical protein